MSVLVEMLKMIRTLVVAVVGSATLLTALTLAGLFFTGCGPKGNKPNVEVIQGMMEQPALKAQDFHPYDREKSSMLVPPKGTWPKNREPYLYSQTQAELAGQKMKNPYPGDAELTQAGKIHFNNYCMVCHGEAGKGDGPVAEKWAPVVVPSLMTDKIRNYPDGRIFHIITTGQGLMGAYITQMPSSKDRWAVVNYVRQLQNQTARGQ